MNTISLKKVVGGLWLSLILVTHLAQSEASEFESLLCLETQSDSTIFAKNTDQRFTAGNASKIAALYVIFEMLEQRGISLSEEVEITEPLERIDGENIFLQTGDRITISDLLKAVALISANDALIVLVKHLGFNELSFVTEMNKIANGLGLSNTRFSNMLGTESTNQYTTARDLVNLVKSLLEKFPESLSFFSEKSMTWHGINHYNTNEMVWRDPKSDGLLSANIGDKSLFLITTKTKERRIITAALTIGDRKESARLVQAKINEALENYRLVRFFKALEVVKVISLKNSPKKFLKAGFESDVHLTVPSNMLHEVTTELTTIQPQTAPIESGTVVGKATIRLGKNEIRRVDVVALENAEEQNFLQKGWFTLKLLFSNLLNFFGFR
jgi:D-alanyl-D-alanine carboxypeptidase (penicillin-binding protein 5/6)